MLPCPREVCRKTERGKDTDLQYRNDACVPFRENHLRNIEAVTNGKCTSPRCAQMWRKFNGGTSSAPRWSGP